jgi:hypothetical protein
MDRRLGLCGIASISMLLLLLAFPLRARGEDTLFWNTNTSKVTADIRDTDWFRLLAGISAATGWRVYVEPETAHRVSTKFKDLPPGEALRLLLGDVNFAFVPQTNNKPRLYVFRTSAGRATQLMQPTRLGNAGEAASLKKLPGELVVRLKPGAKIEDLAKALGAKVIGHIDSLNAYRLKFDDQEAADAGRQQLANNSDVTSVDDNFSIDRPMTPRELGMQAPPMPHLEVKPPTGSDRVVVGVVDTAVQPLGNGLDAFLQKQLYAAGDVTLDPNSPSHGTTVASTMLQSIASASKGSTSIQILPVDIYGPNPSTSTFDAAQGVAMAVNNGATIINMSFGGAGGSQIMHDVISEASAKGIMFIAAAGNDGSTEKFYPAAYPEVLAVTALDNGQLAPYANHGDFVSLAASGTSIISYGGRSYYAMGTSEAAPKVAGTLAAHVESSHPSMAESRSYLGTTYGFKPPAK